MTILRNCNEVYKFGPIYMETDFYLFYYLTCAPFNVTQNINPGYQISKYLQNTIY